MVYITQHSSELPTILHAVSLYPRFWEEDLAIHVCFGSFPNSGFDLIGSDLWYEARTGLNVEVMGCNVRAYDLHGSSHVCASHVLRAVLMSEQASHVPGKCSTTEQHQLPSTTSWLIFVIFYSFYYAPTTCIRSITQKPGSSCTCIIIINISVSPVTVQS